jgi:hypothetical protein
MQRISKTLVTVAFSASIFLTGTTVLAAAKPLANSDVVAMLKAGLPENTIILSIQQSPSKFDTAPQSLILLKKQGVNAKIIDAMLKKQSGAGTAKATAVASAPSTFNGVRVIINGESVAMKRGRVLRRSSSGWLSLVTAFGDSKNRAVLEGNASRLRIKDTKPVFEVALPEDVAPEGYINLLRLEVKGDRRQIETSRSGFSLSDGARSKEGFASDRRVYLEFEDTGNRTPSGQVIYRAIPSGSMASGEYTIVHSLVQDQNSSEDQVNGNYYDFAIDAS